MLTFRMDPSFYHQPYYFQVIYSVEPSQAWKHAFTLKIINWLHTKIRVFALKKLWDKTLITIYRKSKFMYHLTRPYINKTWSFTNVSMYAVSCYNWLWYNKPHHLPRFLYLKFPEIVFFLLFSSSPVHYVLFYDYGKMFAWLFITLYIPFIRLWGYIQGPI